MRTKTMNKVLIAIDFDLSAQKIAETGYAFAKAMNAEIVLLHVIADGSYYSSLDYSPITGFMGLAETDFSNLFAEGGLIKATEHFLEKTKRHLGDEKIQTIVKEGINAEAILLAAKELHADIIVMGSHSRSWLDEILIGSVTEKVLRGSTIPLFIVPSKKRD